MDRRNTAAPNISRTIETVKMRSETTFYLSRAHLHEEKAKSRQNFRVFGEMFDGLNEDVDGLLELTLHDVKLPEHLVAEGENNSSKSRVLRIKKILFKVV